MAIDHGHYNTPGRAQGPYRCVQDNTRCICHRPGSHVRNSYSGMVSESMRDLESWTAAVESASALKEGTQMVFLTNDYRSLGVLEEPKTMHRGDCGGNRSAQDYAAP